MGCADYIRIVINQNSSILRKIKAEYSLQTNQDLRTHCVHHPNNNTFIGSKLDPLCCENPTEGTTILLPVEKQGVQIAWTPVSP